MMRFRILVVTLFAVFAVGVIVASPASAFCVRSAGGNTGLFMKKNGAECEEPLGGNNEEFELITFLLAVWLLNGVAITSAVLVGSSGELLLEDTNVLGLKAQVLCSGILDGFVEPESLDLITDVLTLAGEEVNLTSLEVPALACTNEANCPEPLVWAVKLPWETEVELLEEDGGPFFVVLILGEPGWHVECMGSLSDECKASEAVFQLDLSGGTLLGLFSEAITELAGETLGNCTLGGAETGVVEGEGTISPSEGGELTASSDGVSA